jgi:hypothetical protein|tara:strand:+ start:138 stop:2072 length:1935 start_codon:yes stop_codon:yes gene_type:complete
LSDDFDFVPKLGRIRSQGKAKTQLKRLNRVVSMGRLGNKGRKSLKPGTLRNKGRGKAQAALVRHWSNQRARRVIVKVHIARSGPTGAASFGKHVAYIRRDGAGRDGERGKLYDRSREEADGKAFNERASDDSRQFRLIVSAEDAEQMKDLTRFTREFMAKVEQDLGVRLDWVAANHHDTAQPHVHIVIRGGNTRNGELLIDRKYITHGFRTRAQELVTLELGQRRLREMAAARSKEAEREALTAIDHDIARTASDGRVTLERDTRTISRFDAQVLRRRLRFLETLDLTSRDRSGWTMKSGWQDELRALGRRGDIIRSLSNIEDRKLDASNLHALPRDLGGAGEILGRLSATLPGDELRNGKTALIEGLDGRVWSVELTEQETLQLPKVGGIVSVCRKAIEPKPADRTIAAIAERNGGVYSEELHEAVDPASSPAFRLAHKRRLEALRRLGIVERNPDGNWRISADFERLASNADAKRQMFAVNVRSWLPIEVLVERHAETWLDRMEPSVADGARGALATELNAAAQARRAWLQQEGYVLDQDGRIAPDSAADLRRGELEAAIGREAERSGLSYQALQQGEQFKGRYARDIELAQGRFAVIEGKNGFAIVRTSERQVNWRGRDVTLNRSGRTIQWALKRSRSIGS